MTGTLLPPTSAALPCIWSAAAVTRVASPDLQPLDHRGNLGAERAGRIKQCVAALSCVEIRDELFECLEVGDQRGNGLGIAAADEVDGLLPERIGLRDETGREYRLHIIFEMRRGRICGIREAGRSR